MISEQSVREIVENSSSELSDAICDVLKALIEPLAQRLSECEKSLGLLVDGQCFIERALVNVTTPPDDAEDSEARE